MADDFSQYKRTPQASASPAGGDDFSQYKRTPNAAPTTTAPAPANHGFGSLVDSLTAVPSEIGNIASGLYHNFTDDATDQERKDAGIPKPSILSGQSDPFSGVLPHLALGVKRMVVDPVVAPAKQAVSDVKAGNYSAAARHAESAIPVVGPWADKVENDVGTEGIIPGMLKLGTDIYAPKAAGSVLGSVAETGGRGAQIAAATPEAQALAATRAVVPGSASETLLRGLKPSSSYPMDFGELTNRVMPDIIRADPNNGGVAGFEDAAERARIVNHNVFDQTMLRPAADVPIDLRPVGLAYRDSLPAIDALDPDTVASNSADAVKKFSGTKPLGEVNDLRVNANQKMHAFNDASGTSQWAAQGTPEVAGMKAIHDELANQEYQAISDKTGIPVDEIRAHQAQYGALRDMDDIAHNRATVYGRQSPISLPETMAFSAGHALTHPLGTLFNFGLQRLLKNVTGSDALVNSAVDRFEHPYMTPLEAGPGAIRHTVFPLGQIGEYAGQNLRRLWPFAPVSEQKDDK
jgi:hypothetical protein